MVGNNTGRIVFWTALFVFGLLDTGTRTSEGRGKQANKGTKDVFICCGLLYMPGTHGLGTTMASEYDTIHDGRYDVCDGSGGVF